jgi:hypothetical protein
MVKEARMTSGGFPRLKTGPRFNPDTARSDRLFMRIHPDMMELFDLRAEEKGMTRSKYVESILVGFMKSDPRNPKISAVGHIDRTAPLPEAMREENPHRFAERWQRFNTACTAVLGSPPPTDWYDETERYWRPTPVDQGVTETPEDAEDRERVAARITKNGGKFSKG